MTDLTPAQLFAHYYRDARTRAGGVPVDDALDLDAVAVALAAVWRPVADPTVPPEAYEAEMRWLVETELRYRGYDDLQVAVAMIYPPHVEDRCEYEANTYRWICDDGDGNSYHPEADEADEIAGVIMRAYESFRPLAVAEGRLQATLEVDRSWIDAVDLAADSDDFSGTASFAAGVAEGRRQAAAEIRIQMSLVASRAESKAQVDTGTAADHPFMIGAEWAARIAEGRTDE